MSRPPPCCRRARYETAGGRSKKGFCRLGIGFTGHCQPNFVDQEELPGHFLTGNVVAAVRR
jgi:hypothetical protein